MNKAQLVDRLSRETKHTKVVCETILNSVLETITRTVKKGEDVRLVDFGTFTTGKRKARTGVNPQTGKKINIPARKVPKFKPGKFFKKAVR